MLGGQLGEDLVDPDAEQDVLGGLAALLEECLVLGVGLELGLLGRHQGRLDLGVGDLDPQLVGVSLVPVGLDQEIHDLAGQRREQLRAVGLERLVGRLAQRGISALTWAMHLEKLGGSSGTMTGCPGVWAAWPFAATYIQ